MPCPTLLPNQLLAQFKRESVALRKVSFALLIALLTASIKAQSYSLKLVDQTNGSNLYVTAPSLNDNGDVAYVKQASGVPVAVNYTSRGTVSSGPFLNTQYKVSNSYSNWWNSGFSNPAPETLTGMGAYPIISEAGTPLVIGSNSNASQFDKGLFQWTPTSNYSMTSWFTDIDGFNFASTDFNYTWFSEHKGQVAMVASFANANGTNPSQAVYLIGAPNSSGAVSSHILMDYSTYSDSNSPFTYIDPHVVLRDAGVAIAAQEGNSAFGIYVLQIPTNYVVGRYNYLTIAQSGGAYGNITNQVHMNDAGDVVFLSNTSGGTQTIFYYSHVTGLITPFVTSGGAYANFYEPSINDSGQICFYATLSTGKWGFFTGPDPVANRICGQGDFLDGAQLAAYQTYFSTCWNNSGQITFTTTLTDGRMVLLVGTPSTYNLKLVDQTNGSNLYVTAPSINDNGDVTYVKQAAGVPVVFNYTSKGNVLSGPSLNTQYQVSNGYANWFSSSITSPYPLTLTGTGAYPIIGETGIPMVVGSNSNTSIFERGLFEWAPGSNYSMTSWFTDIDGFNFASSDYNYTWFSEHKGQVAMISSFVGANGANPSQAVYLIGAPNSSGTVSREILMDYSTYGDSNSPFTYIDPHVVLRDAGVAIAAQEGSSAFGIYVLKIPSKYTLGTYGYITIAQTGGAYGYITNQVHMNNLGDVVFLSNFNSGAQTIFYYNHTTGAISPFVTSGASYSNFYEPSINDTGQICFYANLPNGQWGFFTGSDPVMNRICGQGDALGGSQIAAYQTYLRIPTKADTRSNN